MVKVQRSLLPVEPGVEDWYGVPQGRGVLARFSSWPWSIERVSPTKKWAIAEYRVNEPHARAVVVRLARRAVVCSCVPPNNQGYACEHIRVLHKIGVVSWKGGSK